LLKRSIHGLPRVRRSNKSSGNKFSLSRGMGLMIGSSGATFVSGAACLP
jgi:hypothetical protein